jgi:hypothetical protein
MVKNTFLICDKIGIVLLLLVYQKMVAFLLENCFCFQFDITRDYVSCCLIGRVIKTVSLVINKKLNIVVRQKTRWIESLLLVVVCFVLGIGRLHPGWHSSLYLL